MLSNFKTEVELVDLPRILDRRGNLSFIQPATGIDFEIARVYWIYDVPGGALRHGHAFHRASELIVALSGSFDVVITDTAGKETTVHLNRSYLGLKIPPMTWRRIDNFSTNAVAMVLSSTPYDESDYIRQFDSYAAQFASLEAMPAPTLLPAPPPFTYPTVDPHASSSVADCRIIELPRHIDPQGSLTVVDNANNAVDFTTRRVFYLYDVPGDAERGGHSHFREQEIIVAASGSFDVTVSDGDETRRFTLNRPYRALYVPAGIWRSLDNYSSGASTLVLSNLLYEADDYVRDYQIFKQLTAGKG